MANRCAVLRKKQQEEFNKLPLGFAFSNEQFAEMMKEWGLDPDKDTDKIYRLPGGGFIQKKDHSLLHETIDRHKKEMDEAIEADLDGTGFVYEMFLYEMDNHEYGYTGDLEDTLESLGITSEEIESSEKLMAGLEKAKKEVWSRKVF